MSSRKTDGVQAVADMLQVMNPDERKRLLAGLAERDPALVEELERRIFTFEDLTRLDDAGIRALIAKVPQPRLALALRQAPDGVHALIFRNLSERAGKILKEEIGSLGPRRLSEVRAAQAEIAGIARKLLES